MYVGEKAMIYYVKPREMRLYDSELCKVCFEMNAVKLATVEQNDSSE